MFLHPGVTVYMHMEKQEASNKDEIFYLYSIFLRIKLANQNELQKDLQGRFCSSLDVN